MLEQPNLEECIKLLKKHRTCSAANAVICDGEGKIGDVEIRPEGIAPFDDEHSDCRLHTNHYLTSPFANYETHSLPDSCPRLDRIRLLIRENWGKITVETMKRILADHHGDPGGICRHGEQNVCTQSPATSPNRQRRYCTSVAGTVVWAHGKLIRYRLMTLEILLSEEVRHAT